MKFQPTQLEGVFVIEPEVMQDERGYFSRIFCQNELSGMGVDFTIRQASQSFNAKKGTLRGLHFQREPLAEQKIVQCLRGAMYDVVVDLREHSDTYGEWIANELTEANKKKMYVPKGCGHGFQTLADNTEVLYLMSEFYSPDNYAGVRWNDPLFSIDWPMKDSVVISPQDMQWPLVDNR